MAAELTCAQFLQLSGVLPKERFCEEKHGAACGKKMKLEQRKKKVVECPSTGAVSDGTIVPRAQCVSRASFVPTRMCLVGEKRT